jgi:hypothetical protein
MTAPTEFSPAQLAVLAEARALGGWAILEGSVVRREASGMMSCPVLVASDAALAAITYREGHEIGSAADDPTDPRRPALLAALGMEVTS